MDNPLLKKLLSFGPLPEPDIAYLNDLVTDVIELRSGVDLISEGEVPSNVHLIIDGMACRYKILENGTRHIVAYMMSGDFCDLHVFILKEMDHSIGTLSPCRVVEIPRPRILEMLERPALARAMWYATLVDEATLREWLVNIGGRTAEVRIAHLLCELLFRFQVIGLVDAQSFRLPLTQVHIAETMGLSAVHVNRVLQSLRQDGLIVFEKKQLVIPDVDRLKKFSGFNPNYLHQVREEAAPQP